MRVTTASFLVAFTLLGAATAAVIPGPAGANTTLTGDGEGGEGNHIAAISGISSHPAALPTGAPVPTIPSNITHTRIPPFHTQGSPTFTQSFYPTSGAPMPTGGSPFPSPHSGIPGWAGASDYPTGTPSADTRALPLPTDPGPLSAIGSAPDMGGASGTRSRPQTQPTVVPQREPHRSGFPSTASGYYPMSNVTHVYGYESGYSTGGTVSPTRVMPSASDA